MNVYLIERHDMTPNAVRDGVEPTFCLQRAQPVTQPGGEAIDFGWLGTHNDIYMAAHGCYDVSTKEGQEDLRYEFRNFDITTPTPKILAWAAGDVDRLPLKVKGVPAVSEY